MSKQSIDAMRRCWHCGEDHTSLTCPDCGEDTLDAEQWADRECAAGEAADEQRLADYHDGGSSFRTLDEQHREAYEQKRRLR